MFWLGKKKNNGQPENTDFIEGNGIKKDDVEERAKRIMTIINYLTDGILVLDNYSKISFINPEAEKLLDVNGAKAIGQHIFRLNQYPNAQRLLSILEGEVREISRKEVQINENFILEVSIIPMVSGGQKIGALVVLHDITQDKLVQRMKSEFVTVAAHQLRTPASVVKWTMDMLLNSDYGNMTGEQRKMVEMAYHTNEKIIRLVNDLLDVAQIEEGKYLSRVALADFMGVLAPIVDSYKTLAQNKKVNLVFIKPKDGLPRLMMDADKMKIALTNIIDNAVAYTPENGKVIVAVQYNEKNKEAEGVVSDNGIGIPEFQQKNVFSKFFRGSNAVKIDTEGTGLGLFISKNIIEAHGGRVWFDSKEGKGTNIYFTIPVKGKFTEFLTSDFY